MKKIIEFVFAVCILCTGAFTSCSKDESDGDAAGDPLAVNRWIEQKMRADYLWSNEMPDQKKMNFDDEPESFFYSLLSMKDGKTKGESHYYYSYIEKNENYTGTRTSINPDNTYGLEFTVFTVVNRSQVPLGYYWVRVLYVLPDSPAAAAGLARGDWIVGFDGKVNNITNNNYRNLLKGGSMKLAVGKINPGESTFVDITSSGVVEDNPLLVHKVIPLDDGRKVGYLLYNHFTTGPKDHTDRTYDEEMAVIFNNEFKDVNEFVLDLRYNSGGYLSSANVLAGLLVPAQNQDDIFCITKNNKNNSSARKFNKEGTVSPLSLNRNRLFVLTSTSTASASEAVINGLSPFMDVILIGERTEGKNVGSVNYAENKYEWAIQPITIRLTSSETDLDYSAGLVPNYFRDEFGEENVDDTLLPLGDRDEFLLSKAIELIVGNQKSVSIKNESQPAQRNRGVVYTSIERHQTNGVLLEPDYATGIFQ